MTTSLLTLIIPTKNRSSFLIKLLKYYADSNFKHWIAVGDSSDREHVQLIKEVLETLKKKLKIIYFECPELNDSACIKKLAESASTPYVVFCADDDFLIPAGLEECIHFLENHKDYSAAHGLGAIVNVQSCGIQKYISDVGGYAQPCLEQTTAAQRFLKHMANYSVSFFSVHRVEVWEAMYRRITEVSDKTFTELLPCCVSVIRGKIKQLNCFYLVRRNHSKRYFLPNHYEWLTAQDWYASYQVFSDCLSEELISQEGLKKEEAAEVIKQAFWSYLAKGLNRGFQLKYNKDASTFIWRFKKITKSIPGIGIFLLLVSRRLKGDIFCDITLQTLKNPASLYHKEFMPIYQSITEG